jgi:hypothetical protein
MTPRLARRCLTPRDRQGYKEATRNQDGRLVGRNEPKATTGEGTGDCITTEFDRSQRP